MNTDHDSDRPQDHARCAIAALKRFDLEKGLLDGVEGIATPQALDGRDRLAANLTDPDKAGVRGLAVDAGSCQTQELRHRMAEDADIVAVIVKGGAFLRTAAIAAGEAALVDVPDFRMAFNEPWCLTEPVRIGRGAELVARLGFDNTADNPQQPSSPPRDVVAGLPPYGEDAIVIVLYAVAE